MRATVIGIGCGLLLGCAPDIGANTTERCETHSDCSAGQCYRGFCVDQDVTTPVSGSVPVEPPTVSGSAAEVVSSKPAIIASESTPDAASTTDAGARVDAASKAEVDAGTATPATQPMAPSTAAPGQNTPGRSQPTSAPDAMAPPTSSAPAAPRPVDAGVGAPRDAALASAPRDAAGPSPIPGNCTLAECCAEALSADSEQKEARGEKAGDKTTEKGPGKSCGCSDPALLGTLTCGVLGPLGTLL